MKLLQSLVLGTIAVSQLSYAGNVSFQGVFTADTDVQFFTFTLAADTPNVALVTYSYGGGTNAASQSISRGGFPTHLSVFMSDGSAMNPGVVGPCAGPLTADSVTGVCGDVYYPTTLSFPGGVWTAGTYYVALSQDSNGAVGNLTDGFFANVVLGLPSPSNYTCQVGSPGFQGSPPTYPVNGPFCDSVSPFDTLRNGHWALDILNVTSANVGLGPVPEPGTWSLSLLGLAGVAIRATRRRISRQ